MEPASFARILPSQMKARGNAYPNNVDLMRSCSKPVSVALVLNTKDKEQMVDRVEQMSAEKERC